MDKEDIQEIVFELIGGKWYRIEEDPDDDEFEIEIPLTASGVYERVQKLKANGWKVQEDVDPSFNGYILTKPRASH